MIKKSNDFSDDVLIVCRFCRDESTISDWDDCTYLEAKNRQERRDYVTLTSKKAYHRLSDVWYKCPVCGQWTRGNVLMEKGCILVNEIEL